MTLTLLLYEARLCKLLGVAGLMDRATVDWHLAAEEVLLSASGQVILVNGHYNNLFSCRHSTEHSTYVDIQHGNLRAVDECGHLGGPYS